MMRLERTFFVDADVQMRRMLVRRKINDDILATLRSVVAGLPPEVNPNLSSKAYWKLA
jgi:hypothetical protein